MRNKSWVTDDLRELFGAFVALETEDECAKFLRDLLTEDELAEFAARWQTVRMIERGYTYREISQQTGLSTATITRVARWLKGEVQGYRMMLDKLRLKETH